MNLSYALLREKRIDYRYRLKRRTKEVLKIIDKYFRSAQAILDLGTAEGRMLEYIKVAFGHAFYLGLDSSFPLLLYGKNRWSDLHFICADAEDLSFIKNETFDVIIAAALIEHLRNPLKMLKESYRVLKRNGILIITTPNPFWESIARILGLIEGEHCNITSLRRIIDSCQREKFFILEAHGFMISPIGLWGEDQIEDFLIKLKLDKFLLNQLVVAKKL